MACASPAYLAQHVTPATPQDLIAHEWLTQEGRRRAVDEWIGRDGARHRIRVRNRITSNNQLSLKQLTLAGFGLSLQVLPEIAEELADGRLVQVLPDFSLAPLPVNVLLPGRGRQSAKVRCTVDALASYFADATERARRLTRPSSGRQNGPL